MLSLCSFGRLQVDLGSAQEAPRPPQEAPKTPQDPPRPPTRSPQEAPRAAQEASRLPQDRPKKARHAPKTFRSPKSSIFSRTNDIGELTQSQSSRCPAESCKFRCNLEIDQAKTACPESQTTKGGRAAVSPLGQVNPPPAPRGRAARVG